MTEPSITEKVCIVCRGPDSPSKGVLKEIKTKKGRSFSAHEECIEGLHLLLLTRKESVAFLAPRRKTCASIVEGLFLDGWFDQSRQLVDVIDKTKQKGYNFTKPAIANALRHLVRKDVLLREGKTGAYSYIQKRPPTGDT